MSETSPGPGAPSKAFPRWPLAILLGGALVGGGITWAMVQLKHRIPYAMGPLPVPAWILCFLLPGLAALLFMLAWKTRSAWRITLFAGMACLLVLQAVPLVMALFSVNRKLLTTPYSSRREYTTRSKASGWADPLHPACYELGDGMKLVMSTTCFTDASGHTLPLSQGATLTEPAPDFSNRPLSQEALGRLVVFTKAFGYLRFFHPSDASTGVNWNTLAIQGMTVAEEATGPQDLARRLQALFDPWAPGVQFLAPGESPRTVEVPPEAKGLVRWHHIGLGELKGEAPSLGRSSRLASVAVLWTVLQHFYPYFDVAGTDWDAELPKALQKAASDPDPEHFLRTLRVLVAALKDGHGWVSYAGSAPGGTLPLSLRILEGQVYIASDGTQQIPTGSRVVAIGGLSLEQRLEELRQETSAATPGAMDAKMAGRLLWGHSDPKVRIAFITPGGNRRDLDMTTVSTRDFLRGLGLPPAQTELRPGVWYVDLDRTQEEEFSRILPNLAQAKGVIFDLRGYPSMSPRFLQHLTDRPLSSARWNVPDILEPDRQRWSWNTPERWLLQPLKPSIAGKVVFLTEGGAISYAESCLGIVEAYKLAEIVGEPSAGTNGNINPISLPGGYRVTWTGMKVLKHDGSRHHGVGILPTVPVKPTPEGLAEGRDEVLEKALRVIGK